MHLGQNFQPSTILRAIVYETIHQQNEQYSPKSHLGNQLPWQSIVTTPPILLFWLLSASNYAGYISQTQNYLRFNPSMIIVCLRYRMFTEYIVYKNQVFTRIDV